jgi:hypothetical protein
MGYDLHITRSPDWWDATGRIAYEEWRRIAESDPDLELDATAPEEGYRLRGSDFGNFFYYDDRAGTINVRPVLLECTRKAADLAARLGAVVQGDEGEYYRLTESFYETVRERPSIDVSP